MPTFTNRDSRVLSKESNMDRASCAELRQALDPHELPGRESVERSQGAIELSRAPTSPERRSIARTEGTVASINTISSRDSTTSIQSVASLISVASEISWALTQAEEFFAEFRKKF
ncbi:hypothetical protein FQN57_005833 [Myotisia sp. PD_48]|nr:hypothetical protein FQN57_005833 [Myotisia sp. PD_48]